MPRTYKHFLESEPAKSKERGVDERGRFEWRRIGMVRNAKEENTRRMKVYLDPAPHVILDQNVPLRGWYKGKRERKGVRARPCFSEALLTQPYGGACPVRCLFCYVNNGVRGYRGQGITVVDPNYPQKVAAQLAKMRFAWNAYISSFTEPFQKLESVYHNTERLSRVVTDAGLPLFYLTRQIPPDWAIRYLQKSPYSYQQFSIITPDRTDYRKLSPNAAPIDDVLRFIREELRPRGIYVSIQVNPVVPGVVSNEQIEALIRELAKAGANHVIFKFVEIVSPAAGPMVEKVRKVFGERGDRFAELFTENIGGLKTIVESYRVPALRRYREVVDEVGMTMGLCYEYAYKRDAEGKVVDKTGESIGREFCTGAQCHGPYTPVHIRKGRRFVPFKGCPPTGCLYCEEEEAGDKPPCGVAKLAEARALSPRDYETDHWGMK